MRNNIFWLFSLFEMFLLYSTSRLNFGLSRSFSSDIGGLRVKTKNRLCSTLYVKIWSNHGEKYMHAKSFQYVHYQKLVILWPVYRPEKVSWDFPILIKMYLNLQLRLIYHPKVVIRILQNGDFLLPMHHLVLQVNSLELGISLLKKFTSQLQNSLQIIKLEKVDLELSIEESLTMEQLSLWSVPRRYLA